MAQLANFANDVEPQEMRNAQPTSPYPADWYIEDEAFVGQSIEHQGVEFRTQSKLLAWKARTNQTHLLMGCELVCRWDEAHPGVGVDPDIYVCIRPPADPRTGDIYSVRTWKEGNFPPILAIEVVSKDRPGKDYKDSPKKHDLLGTSELWVFDPQLCGYTPTQPPVLLQVFRREPNRRLVQKHAGEGPYRSSVLDAWVMVKDGELVIANDPEGNDQWPTLEEEVERRRVAEAKRADDAEKRAIEAKKHAIEAKKHASEAKKRADAERAEKDAALARVAELEALLAKRS